ncbi:MAG: agmatine deiminase family protein [Bacteroidota bacterium]
MKKPLLFLSILFCFFSCQPEEEVRTTPRIPGEFEPHEAIWLGYSTGESEGVREQITIDMIKAIHPHVHVNLIVEQDSLSPNLLDSLALEGIDTSQISIVFQTPTDIWYRDPGPIFAVSPENELVIIDFKYTNYANVLPDSIGERARGHEAIDRDIATRLDIDTVPSIIAIEGGAFETDGQGTLIQVEAITLGRNPHLTKAEIEADYQRCCGIEQVIWLPSGVADDPHNFSRISGNIFGFGTGGHTDEFVRFANDSTILLAWEEESEQNQHPIKQLNYEIFSKNYEILAAAKNVKGEPYRVIKVPHPDPQLDTMQMTEDWFSSPYWSEQLSRFQIEAGDTIYWASASSYLNYLITNEVVLIPAYGGDLAEKDQQVREIFTNLYPDRTIIGLDPIDLNYDGGGMHCRYQQQPKIQ